MAKLHAVVSKADDEDLYVAQAVEVDVASQGRTPDEAVDNLVEAVELWVETAAGGSRAIEVQDTAKPWHARTVELREVEVSSA